MLIFQNMERKKVFAIKAKTFNNCRIVPSSAQQKQVYFILIGNHNFNFSIEFTFQSRFLLFVKNNNMKQIIQITVLCELETRDYSDNQKTLEKEVDF